MADYGFKFPGLIVPDGVNKLNLSISNNGGTYEYELTRDEDAFVYDDGEIHISLNMSRLISNSNLEIISDKANLEPDLSSWIFDNQLDAFVIVDNHTLEYNSETEGYEYHSDNINYLLLQNARGEYYLTVTDANNTAIPGIYNLQVWYQTNIPSAYVSMFDENDAGDEYNVILSYSGIAEAFADAVRMVVGSGKTIIYVSQSDLMNYSSGNVNGYKDEAMTTPFASGEITVESDLVVYCVSNNEITTTIVPFMKIPDHEGNPGICYVLIPGQNGVSAIPVEYCEGE